MKDSNAQPTTTPPLGDGMLCSGGLWIVRVGVTCPVCGAPPIGGCLRDLDELPNEEREAHGK